VGARVRRLPAGSGWVLLDTTAKHGRSFTPMNQPTRTRYTGFRLIIVFNRYSLRIIALTSAASVALLWMDRKIYTTTPESMVGGAACCVLRAACCVLCVFTACVCCA